MSNYEAALRAQLISLRGRFTALNNYNQFGSEERREWELCSGQIDALEAEIYSLNVETEYTPDEGFTKSLV